MFKILLESIINVFLKKINAKTQEETKEEPTEPCYDSAGTPTRFIMDQIDYPSVFMKLEPKNKPSKKDAKVLLVIDDIPMTELLYQSDFNKIKKNYKKDISKDFIYYSCFVPEAGFLVYELIFKQNIKVDYAVLDLTLGYDFKLPNGDYVQLDGVDLANYLLQSNPDIKFIFCSAHTMNANNSIIKLYMDKYSKFASDRLEDKFICKNSNRADGLYNLLYGG